MAQPTKSEIFTAAHVGARTRDASETYRAAFVRNLRAIYRNIAKVVTRAVVAPVATAPVARTTAEKVDDLANIVIGWSSDLRRTFAFRFVSDNADRVARYGQTTRFSPKQAAIIDEMHARYC